MEEQIDYSTHGTCITSNTFLGTLNVEPKNNISITQTRPAVPKTTGRV